MYSPFLLIFIFGAVYSEIVEPQCPTSFDYNHQLLYKLIKVEEEVKSFREFVEELKQDKAKEEKEHKKRLSAALKQFKNLSKEHLQSLKESSKTLLSDIGDSAKAFKAKEEKIPAVGFSVKSPKRTSRSGEIAFSTVITNVAAGFDTATGMFTCKIPGYYYFSASLLKKFTYTAASYCYIRKNDDNLVIAHTQPGHSPQQGRYAAVNSVFVYLEDGDTVKLADCSAVSSLSSRSSFTGFLVTPDPV